MKKILCFILVLCVIFCVTGCEKSKPTVSKNESSEGRTLSDEQKYNSAIKHVQRYNYDKAIKLLEEIPDYNDSKDILGKVHYIYGSELFNKQKFTEADSHFQKASGYDDIVKRRSMNDYYGGIYLTNQGEYVSALTYFKRAIDSDYVKEATIYVSELTGNLLSGGWIGSTNMNNVTLQVEMSYTKSRNTFSLIWADRSNGGYRHVTNMDYGTLSILGSRAAFEYEGSLYTVEFDFYSATSVNVKWSNEKLNNMAGGMFKRNNAAIFEYKIPNVAYPTMIVPELFSDSSDNSENKISNNINSLTEGNLVNKKLIVAVSPDYEPFEYEQNGDLVGFDIDLINLIANELGYYIEYKKCEFDAIIKCVAEGEADLGISAISINDTRLQSVDFTDVYVVETYEEEGEVYRASYAIAVPKGSELTTDLNAQIKKLKDSGKIQELISKYNID